MAEANQTLRRIVEIEAKIQELDRSVLKRGDSGGTSGGMDAWQQSVENRLLSLDTRLGRLDDKVDRNFLVTWGGIIFATLGVLSIIAKVYGVV